MVIAPLLAAPAVMLAATAAERRFGATVAGMVGAAPVALAVVILSVGDGAVAASAAAHVVAQVAFAVAFALVIVRRGGTVGALAGVAAYAGVSALVEFVPPALAIAAAIPALLLAPRLLPEHPREPGAAPEPRDHRARRRCLRRARRLRAHRRALRRPRGGGRDRRVPRREHGVRAGARPLPRHPHSGERAQGARRSACAATWPSAWSSPATGPAGVALGLVVCAAQSFLPRNSVRPGGLGSSEKPSLVYSAIADVFASLTSSSIRRHPRARARSKHASVSARPSPVPRAESRT